eukprot:12930971-Prorocentrum_lima.AAC.1
MVPCQRLKRRLTTSRFFFVNGVDCWNKAPHSIHKHARNDGRARQFPNGANVNFVGMIADSPLPGEWGEP